MKHTVPHHVELTNQAIFCNTSNQGGVVATPSLDFRNRTPYELGFGISR